ncbi:thiosulfate sulfurtransferase GlpE [Shewanella intestini]|uniref:Thiosulfate sulfurtransferase GlpE n=1 Tax=Shewanella intestini TaxID=2017544 RepID=A0ABS5I3L8_9GAMM|nr:MULTISPECIES: thiosulfate sulfurtransferase GlpE [Shewanella]MBR9728622.1 thiosulfate sulfurtransferase GlpE [Shewanella intestini]MRG37322.1 thiosulfate sulfurtransferase GlpE [Shewanella sp. XMDDZSB0408]
MSTFKHLSINELIHMTAESDLVQIVDIRDEASFNTAHIAGSINLNNENIANIIADADMDAPLVVVCYHGISSQNAANYLIEQGFDDVYSLDGGYSAWSTANA